MPGKILIVNPIAANRITLKAMLMAEYFDVAFCDAINDMQGAISKHQPDVVLVPSMLNEQSGYDLCLAIKSATINQHIPVIMTAVPNERIDWPRAMVSLLDEVVFLSNGQEPLIASIRRLMRQKHEIDGLSSHIKTANADGFGEVASSNFSHNNARVKIAILGDRTENRDIFPTCYGKTSHISGLDALDQSQYKLIVLDSCQNQTEVMGKLNQMDDDKTPPVLCIVDAENEHHSKRLIELGATSVVSKEEKCHAIALRAQSIITAHNIKKRLIKQLHTLMKQANFDSLTGLYNRRYADQYLKATIKRFLRKNEPFAVMMLDIDKFKAVNDQYGHSSGDEVLIQVSKRLTSRLRKMDMLARFGGEEFLIVLPDTNLQDCQEIAERMRKTIARKPICIPSQSSPINVTISVGATIAGNTTTGRRQVVNCADTALYNAKSNGRNCVKVLAA